MTSHATDNSSRPQLAATTTMPQWKCDLIARRRRAAQQQQQRDKQLVAENVAPLIGMPPSPPMASDAFGCRPPPLGQQPSPTTLSTCAEVGECVVVLASSTQCVARGTKSASSSADRTCCDMVNLHVDSDSASSSSSSEELQYGPGIVSRLKNRYLSLTLREAATKRRPSILRKSTSLENLLDEDCKGRQQTQQRPLQCAKEAKCGEGGAPTNGNAKNAISAVNRYRRGNGMKRARSVEAISQIWSPPTGLPRPASMHEEDIVIGTRVNKPKRIGPLITEREKPPVDVVRQTKRLFESRPESRTRPPQHTGDVAAKVATYKTIIIQQKQNEQTTNGRNVRCKQTNGGVRLQLKEETPPPLVKPLPSPIPDVSMVKEEADDKTSLSETPDLILHSSPAHTQKEPSEPISIPAPIKTEPLVLDVGYSPPPTSSSNRLCAKSLQVLALSPREIEKNAINTATTSNVISEERKEPRKAKPRRPRPPPTPPTTHQPETNCVVFKFTDRKDVPDYICNDGVIRTQTRVEVPKPGEGGITLLPGTSIQDIYKDYDEELASLEGPPSPCDVQFINDNILIDGRSSLSKKSTTKSKMKIQFVESIPQVFEYPSEDSILLDEASPSNQQPLGGTTVPSLSGSTLANYTPKAATNDDFQLGVTKAPLPPPPPQPQVDISKEEDEIAPKEEPMMFSSGTNSDILF